MNQMQDQKTQNENKSKEPFLIIKNARKAVKKKQLRRKQSYQYPTTPKKTRRMTIQISQLHSLIEESSAIKCPSLDLELREEKMEEIVNNEQEMVNIIEGMECKQEDEHQEPEDNIPFSCNEWELDKESPYLKNFNSMNNQIEEFRLDE